MARCLNLCRIHPQNASATPQRLYEGELFLLHVSITHMTKSARHAMQECRRVNKVFSHPAYRATSMFITYQLQIEDIAATI
eukprot:scaffold146174_cov36-Prasinocladus_malaysianus.AAC.1